MRVVFAMLAAATICLATHPARAADMTRDQFLALAGAYQDGFLQVVAASCYQIYSSTGVIATDFSSGQLDGPAALDALGENRLLHSVCYSTLLDVQKLTPSGDQRAQAQLGKIAQVLVAEDGLLAALGDVFSYPSPEHAARVEQARKTVEGLLDTLTRDTPAE